MMMPNSFLPMWIHRVFNLFNRIVYLNQKAVHNSLVLWLMIGCLIFSILGRFFLGIVLKGNMEIKKVSVPKGQNARASTTRQNLKKRLVKPSPKSVTRLTLKHDSEINFR